jgi:endo-1,4-beta-xylanase
MTRHNSSNQAAIGVPYLNTRRRFSRSSERGSLIFRPFFVQRGKGPHLEPDWVYASDSNWDTFASDLAVDSRGLVISDASGRERFGVNVRWNVEGAGYLFLTADNGGEGYSLPAGGQEQVLNLNYELARSRVLRNRRRMDMHRAAGFEPDREVATVLALGDEFLEEAARAGSEEQRGLFAQTALRYGITGGELLEVRRAEFDIERSTPRRDFFIGCDARGMLQMDPDLFVERFAPLFDYATITYYLRHTGMQDFEPQQGALQFGLRDEVHRKLRSLGITVQGRPIFWPHHLVTPDWLRTLSYDDLRRYVEEHTRRVVGHYGDEMYAWEVVNEFHDWSNEVNITPDQMVELTALACDVAADTAPNVHRLINNCCPWAEYVHQRQYSNGQRASHPQRTPWQFMRDLRDAGVDFTITGLQMYFPFRDLADTIILTERFAEFGRPVQWTEIGITSGPSESSIRLGTVGLPEQPFAWHRHSDEDLQADWLESIYTLAYSKPWMEACNWYDFIDGYAWIPQGGLLRSPRGEVKAAYERLAGLRRKWDRSIAPVGRAEGAFLRRNVSKDFEGLRDLQGLYATAGGGR